MLVGSGRKANSLNPNPPDQNFGYTVIYIAIHQSSNISKNIFAVRRRGSHAGTLRNATILHRKIKVARGKKQRFSNALGRARTPNPVSKLASQGSQGILAHRVINHV